MKTSLFPKEYIDSTYNIDFEALYAEGYRGVIFDIDNTLVPHGAPADDRAIALFDRLKAIGFDALLLSNNRVGRVKMFNDSVNVRYIYKAGKPKPGGYREAMRLMDTDESSTLFVGDQIFTDVLGANIAGIHSIMVGKIDPNEEIQIVLKRIPEFFVMAVFRLVRRITGRPLCEHVK